MNQSITFDIIIIGGGPAGLFAAMNLPKGTRIAVLEKNRALCRKLLISGAGRCNFTNANPIGEFLTRYGQHGKWLSNSLKAFDNGALRGLLSGAGVESYSDENGKVFPISENAEEIKTFLIENCHRNSVQIFSDCHVVGIKKDGNNSFIVQTEDTEIASSALLIACGGKSYPSTGSSGDGYALAKSLGHSIVEPRPALTPVYFSPNPFESISGVSLQNVSISLRRNAKAIHKHRGDIGFTHRGVSGPGILDISRYMLADDELVFCFADANEEQFSNDFIQFASANGSASLKSYLRRYGLPESLQQLLTERAQTEPNARMGDVSRNTRKALAEAFCALPIKIHALGGWKTAMATCGGVSTKEVSSRTMQSSICPGLFFAGEVLDIDGDSGGFNIQAAFSTGFAAAKGIIEYVESQSKKV